MMDRTFKFRFVNEITGVFVLLAVAALVAGVFLAGRAQGLFEPKFRLLAVFTAEEGAYGLRKGSEVKIRDTVAGSVVGLEPAEDGTLRATFELKESYHRFVRTNSVALVKKTLIVTGDSYVDISVGARSAPPMPPDSRIPCVPDTDLAKQAAEVLDAIRTRLEPTIAKTHAVLDEIPPLATQARKTLEAAEAVLRRDVPPVTLQAQDTLRETRVLIEGLQRHWLVHKYIEPPGVGPLIPPSQIPWTDRPPTNPPPRAYP